GTRGKERGHGCRMERPSPFSTFIGRNPELATLAASLREAESGRGGLVLVAGPAGMGKTRLLEEACARAPTARTLWGRCIEDAGAPAYWPWMQILRALVDACADDDLQADVGDLATELSRLVPRLRDRLTVVAAAASLGPEP